MTQTDESLPACPIPLADYPRVVLAHGGGGRLMHQLIEALFLHAFGNPLLEARLDSTVIDWPPRTANSASRLAFTTDSYVVDPLVFPGGDIGKLAVCGTVNDLAMSGARPLYLSAGFILEEGLAMQTLWSVAQSMGVAARAAGVQIVTGDTKVVERGKGDGLYINTAGVGAIEHDLSIAPASVRAGDAILLNGDIGRHGMAVMAARAALTFDPAIESDCAPLAQAVQALIAAGIEIHCLRDLTRGGLASAAVEIASGCSVELEIDEAAVAVREEVKGACELLGLDPLYVANEGRFIAIFPQAQAERALDALRGQAYCESSRIIGAARHGRAGRAILRSVAGSVRPLQLLSGEQLPRIC
jgi:hydrogenase expression/formation protein HypE